MIEGLILIAIASALLAAGPTHELLTQRRSAIEESTNEAAGRADAPRAANRPSRTSRERG